MSWFNFRIILIVYGWKIYIEIQNVRTVLVTFDKIFLLYDHFELHKPQHASKIIT